MEVMVNENWEGGCYRSARRAPAVNSPVLGFYIGLLSLAEVTDQPTLSIARFTHDSWFSLFLSKRPNKKKNPSSICRLQKNRNRYENATRNRTQQKSSISTNQTPYKVLLSYLLPNCFEVNLEVPSWNSTKFISCLV